MREGWKCCVPPLSPPSLAARSRCLAAAEQSLSSRLRAAQPKPLSGESAGAHADTSPPSPPCSQLARRHFKARQESWGSHCGPRPALTGGADASVAGGLRWSAFCSRVLPWVLKLNNAISRSGACPALVSGLKAALSSSRQAAWGGQDVLHVLMSYLAFPPVFAVS